METYQKQNKKIILKSKIFWLLVILMFLVGFDGWLKVKVNGLKSKETVLAPKQGKVESAQISSPAPALDFISYDKKLNEMANNPVIATTSTSSALRLEPSLWPVKTAYPNYGALLPFNRIVAYYGNLYSKNMGVLGEYSEDVMLDKLGLEVKKWQDADPNTPVIPALHYIAVVAQGGPSKAGKYIARMPDSQIDRVLEMAKKINGIVFLDIQLGQSDVLTEIPLLEKYLKMPQVHLGIDPEFAMHGNQKPGTVIGTMDAADINFAVNYLSQLVKDNNLTPKILTIHRFTQPMITNYKNIVTKPEVQIVMDMDGFGSQGSKLNTYKQFIYKQPVEFTGFKLFYKNDIVNGKMLTPEQLLRLQPIPVYIQYQ